MSLLDSMNLVGSALTAERFRIDVALQNLACQNITADPATGATQATFGNFTGMGLYLSVFLRSFWLAEGRRCPGHPGGGEPAGLYPRL